MNYFRRNQNTNAFDPDNRRGNLDNVNVNSLNVGSVNVDGVIVNRGRTRNGIDPSVDAANFRSGIDPAVNAARFHDGFDPAVDAANFRGGFDPAVDAANFRGGFGPAVAAARFRDGIDPSTDPDSSRDCGRRCRRREGTEVTLNVASGGAGPLPIVATVLTAPIPVVSITLDGDRLRDVSILFNFTSIISLPLAVTVSLNFQLLRAIDNGAPVPIGPTFTFARTVAALETDSFGFQLFDGQLDADTVTYSVVLAMNSTISANAAVTILNATLSALEIGNEHARFIRQIT